MAGAGELEFMARIFVAGELEFMARLLATTCLMHVESSFVG